MNKKVNFTFYVFRKKKQNCRYVKENNNTTKQNQTRRNAAKPTNARPRETQQSKIYRPHKKKYTDKLTR